MELAAAVRYDFLVAKGGMLWLLKKHRKVMELQEI